ncbi:HAD-IA family hydrolase [Pusillimonas minor]|uniref:phosphoglycolate phosphatase n=1 Tax=Pusillimonas minor TaxID=2697024 RepID=A0A842HL74_9BURK|nr:HAD-IA family hydrolase [Pusillimonas minor]
MKQYDAVIFDWDGTLMDSTHAIVSAIQLACADMQLPVPDRRQASWVIGLSIESALYHVAPDLSSDDLPHFVERYKHHFFQHDRETPLFDGVPQLLNVLREQRVKLAVATGKGRMGLDRVLAASRLGEYFDVTRCADESHGKPHPGMLHDIMGFLSLDPERVLMVGDTTHDVQMAHNAGVDSIAVSYGAHDLPTLQSANPTVLVHSVTEMHDWLSGRVVPAMRCD